MALISLQNVSISFGSPHLPANISLQIEANQCKCLLGRNGSGKTTLMKIIDEQISPDTELVLKEKKLKSRIFPRKFKRN